MDLLLTTGWYYDLANDCEIIPMRDKETGKPFRFLDWLEYLADRTESLRSNEYFSFSETVQPPKAPDNPDIMGKAASLMKERDCGQDQEAREECSCTVK